MLVEYKSVGIVAILLLGFFQIFSQNIDKPNPFDRQYFRSPVDYDFTLSGSFCELRETHFHTGIDIKPKTVYGKTPLYAIGKGYISRVKISAGGYGKALYIDHPEVGFTSVYAHMDDFEDRVEHLIQQYQWAFESYEVDILLEPTVLPIEKGEFIGNMGNTGYSFGKHLHFEIRDTKTENPIHPFHFGIQSEDHIQPTIMSLAVHGLDPDYHKIWEYRVSIPSKNESQIYLPQPIEVPAWRAGIALNMIDRSDNSHNKQGIYGFHLYVDDTLIYSYHLDKISFDQSRYIIGFYDYKVRKSENTTYALCYKYPGNDLAFLEHTGNGLIPVYISKAQNIRIEIEDFHKNRKTLHFSLIRSAKMTEQPAKDSTSIRINVGDSISIDKDNLSAYFEPNSLFRNINLSLKKQSYFKGESKYAIHDLYEPIKTPIKISLKPEVPIIDKLDKAIIVRTNENGGNKINYGGKWINDALCTYMTEFGIYGIEYDTVAPFIKSINFTPNVGKKSEIRFSIKDNLPTKGKFVDDIKIKVWIDGKFKICPYSSKTQILQIPLDKIENGNHILSIEAIDHSGNIAKFNAEFVIRK